MVSNEVPLLKKDIAIMNDKLDNLTKDFKEHTTKVETYFERLEHKFASKWVERAFLAWAGFILLWIIGALLKLIIK